MDAAVQRCELVWPVTRKPWIDIRHHTVILIEAEVLIFQIVERGDEQTGSREQNKREGGLEHNQRFTRKRFHAQCGTTSSAKGFDRIYPRGHPCGSYAERNSSDQRNTQGKQQNRHGRRRTNGHTCDIANLGECKMQNKTCAPESRCETCGTAEKREQNAFCEGLPYKPRRLRPQRHAQRYLLTPLHAANQHEIGYVGADDE